MFSGQIWCFFIGTGCAIFHDTAASDCVSREEFESRLLELTESHQKEIRKLKEVNEALERRVESLETQRIQNKDAAIKNEKETNGDDYEEVFVKTDEEKASDYKDLVNDAVSAEERMDITTRLPLSNKTSAGTKTAAKLRKQSQRLVNEKNIRPRYLVNEAAGVPVAFSLLLNSSVITNLGTNQIIKFNKIITNIDSVYDLRLGVFTAPISGYYAISLAMMTRPNETQMLYVMKDGVKMFHVYATGTFFNTATKTMVIQVNKGQEVWVQTTEDPGFSHNLHGFDHAAFTGFLFVTREEFESRLLELTESHQKEIRKLKEVNKALERRIESLETQSIQNNEAAIDTEKETNGDDYKEVFVNNDDENARDYLDLVNDFAVPIERIEITNRLPLSDKTSAGTKTAAKFRKQSQRSVKDKNIHPRYLVNEAEGVPVAFSLLLNSSVVTNLGTNQIIKFNKVVTNIDNVYDLRLGVFTAPISGYYAISLAMMTRPNETQILYVMRDGVKMFHVYATGTFFNTATKTMVIQVNKGQEVWVQTSENPGYSHNLHGFDHAAFTGFLLYASDI